MDEPYQRSKVKGPPKVEHLDLVPFLYKIIFVLRSQEPTKSDLLPCHGSPDIDIQCPVRQWRCVGIEHFHCLEDLVFAAS